MSSTITPNMGLIVPGVGTEPGPTWASDLNSDLGVLDQHNHSNGQGVQINPAGININSDLPINGNNLTTIKTANFTAQAASLPGTSPNLGCVYVAGNELYYNDEAGNVVPITNNGSVNAGAGSITGLPSGTASASYSSGSGTFVWQSATSTPANMDMGSVILRNIIASSKGLTISPPNSLVADYAATFLPPNGSGGTVFVTYDTSNNMGLGPATANGITRSNLAAVGQQVSSSCGSFVTNSAAAGQIVTNMTITLTTTGRPVMLLIQDDGLTALSQFQVNPISALSQYGEIMFFRGATQLNSTILNTTNNVIGFWPGSLVFLDTPTAGTYTYTVQAKVGGAACFLHVENCVLMAYEL